MSQKFCTKCGVKLIPSSRFCTECGEPAGAASPPRSRTLQLGRHAPLLVFLATVGIGVIVVWVGSQSAKPPPRNPSRQAGPPQGQLPEGHPPVSLPEDVRATLATLADDARANPDDLVKWRTLAQATYRAGQVEKRYLADADAAYLHILEREPADPEALVGLGNLAFDREQPKRAIEYYEKYVAVKPDDANVLTDMGTMYLALGDSAKAIEIYQRVLGQDPKFFQAQFNLGLAYRAARDVERATEALKRAREIAPDDQARGFLDQLLARGVELPPEEPPPAQASGAVAEQPAGPGGFRTEVESVFRGHSIIGPKLEGVEWPDEQTARVVLRGFPMDQMPEDMRAMFAERIRGELKAKKAQSQVTAALQVELVDADSGQVMDTITE